MTEFELRNADAQSAADTHEPESLSSPQPIPLGAAQSANADHRKASRAKRSPKQIGAAHNCGDTQESSSRADLPPKPSARAHPDDVPLPPYSPRGRPQNLNGGAHRLRDAQLEISPPVEAHFDAGRAQRSSVPHGGYSPVGVDPALGDDGAHYGAVTHCGVSPVITEIVSLWRQRQRWLRAEVALILQSKALCRSWCGGDKKEAAKLFALALKGKANDPTLEMALSPFLPSIAAFQLARKPWDKRIEKLAVSLPIYEWVKGISGFGAGNLGRLIGEAGDIGSYKNPSCLWKRMGMACIDGQRQRKLKDEDLALLHGYSPQRRASAFVISECMIKKKNRYRVVYDERKALKMAAGWTKNHAHKEGMRFMVKRVLRDLYNEWTGNEPT